MPWESKIRSLHNGMVDKHLPESGPLAEVPDGQLTQTAEMSPEQSKGEQRRSRGVAQESWTDALGEQDSRFAQRNG